MKPRPRSSAARERHSLVMQESVLRLYPRRESTATDDPQMTSAKPDSFRFVLFDVFQQRFLCFPYVLQRQCSGVHEVRHNWPGPTAEETQQLVDKPALRRL